MVGCSSRIKSLEERLEQAKGRHRVFEVDVQLDDGEKESQVIRASFQEGQKLSQSLFTGLQLAGSGGVEDPKISL
jgi:hypothetical protein